MTGIATGGIFAAAGLLGAAGVAAAAAAAHVTGGGSLASAAEILMIHAAALTGLGAAVRTGGRGRGGFVVVAAGLALGAGLFGGDVALRALSDHRLFPMAAPIGGSILIGSWLVLAILALAGRLGAREPS